MSKENKPGLVSVIVPAYNRASLIAETMDSVFAQTYRPIELLIVDDGSTDKTGSVVKEWASKHNGSDSFCLRYFYQENSGAPAARNRGMSEAQGEFIQFLDSDDKLDPIKFERQIEAIKESGFPVAVCDYLRIATEDKTKNILRLSNSGNLWKKVANMGSLFISTPLIQSDSIAETLRWNTDVKRNQDMDFMLRYFLGVRGWIYTPGFWSIYIIHKNSQISDSYYLGTQYFKLVKSLYTYWWANKSVIPKENRWIVLRFAVVIFRLFLSKWILRMPYRILCSLFPFLKGKKGITAACVNVND